MKVPNMNSFKILISLLRQGKQKKLKMELHQFKCSCTTKEIDNNTKRQPTEWKTIFADDTSTKRLISKIYKTDTTQHQKPK